MKIRDWDITIKVANKDAYENSFLPLLKDSIRDETFINLINEMKVEASKKGQTEDAFKIAELFDLSDDGKTQKKAEFQDVVDRYVTKDSLLKNNDLDMDVLNYLFDYIAAEYFKKFFYINLDYHPPIDLSAVFYPVLNEINESNSSELTFLNPFSPYCENLEEDGQIYHALVSKRILKAVYAELLKKNDDESEDLRYLSNIFEKGIKGEVLIFFVLTP